MNRSFLQFNDSAFSSGVLSSRPDLAQELKQTTETFVKLAKVAAAEHNSGDDEENGDGEGEEAIEEVSVYSTKASHMPNQAPQRQRPSYEEDWTRPRVAQGTASISRIEPRETVEWNLNSFTETQVTATATSRSQEQQQNILPFGLIPGQYHDHHNTYQQYNVAVSSPPPPIDLFPVLTNNTTLPSPVTYSFQESTFSRRLLRATMERAFHLLCTKRYRPHIYERVFCLCLKHTSHENLVRSFRDAIAKGANEEIENFDHPLITLGGAGTHYPKRDAFGTPVYKPNQWRIRRDDTYPTFVIEDEHGNTRDLGVDTAGYEGEWFDPLDIQGYLEERGCHIDAQSSFAELEIDVPRYQSGSASPLTPSGNSNSGVCTTTHSNGAAYNPFESSLPDPYTYPAATHSNSSSSGAPSTGSPPTPSLREYAADPKSVAIPSRLASGKTLDTTYPFNPALVPDFDAITGASAAAAAAAIGAPAPAQGEVSAAASAAAGLFSGFRFDYPGMGDAPAGQAQYAARQLPHRAAMVKRVITIDIAKFIDGKYPSPSPPPRPVNRPLRACTLEGDLFR